MMPNMSDGSNPLATTQDDPFTQAGSMSEVKPPPAAPHVMTADAPAKEAEPLPTSGQSLPVEAQVETAFGLSDGDRRVLGVLVGIAVALMAVHWYRLSFDRPAPLEILHPEGYLFQLDVNDATWVEWMQLEGIGETLARRIVDDRQQHGPFESVADIQRVSGIGPKRLAALRPHLICAPARTSNPKPAIEHVTATGK